jgi:hypothetical protein
VAGPFEHGNEPPCSKKVWKFLSSCETVGFSIRTQFHGVRDLVVLRLDGS